MNPIQSILTQFSFTEQESDVYIACLTLGPAKLTDIALKLDKNRTAVYFHVKNLVKKGFLKEGKKGRVMKFTAIAPADVSEKFERLTEDFKNYVPQLEALNRIDTDTPIITVQESRIGYRKVYEELASLPPKSMFRVLEGKKAIESEMKLLTQEEFYTFFTRVTQRQIETKGLFTREALLVPNRLLTKDTYAEIKKRIWHMRTTTEENLPFQDLIFIYENKVALMFPESSLVVTIKHRGIADAMTVLFDTLYLFADPEKTPW
jgi:predicted transcriptional regulator